MLNIKIDSMLAELMGYEIFGYDDTTHDLIVLKDDGAAFFKPSRNMGDAWDVANRLGLETLRKSISWRAIFTDGSEAEEVTAELAICMAALKVNRIDKKKIGERIKQIRNAGRWSLKDFGEIVLNASKGTVSNWEHGVNVPNKKRIERLARIGNKNIDWILYGINT